MAGQLRLIIDGDTPANRRSHRPPAQMATAAYLSPLIYRRPLPRDAIAFSSPEGRQLFTEALAAGGLEGYFALAEQLHTQSDPAFCGLGSLVVALDVLGIDPGRLWKGPWRWFAEDLLDCCVPLEQVRARGLDLDELACLARCNGAGNMAITVRPSSPACRSEARMLPAPFPLFGLVCPTRPPRTWSLNHRA